jgi:O-acetylserine/cysteine efflux transporter
MNESASVTPPVLQNTITVRSIAGMLVLAVMWGISIPITKLGLETVPPLTLTALRFAVAVPLLFALAMGKQGLPPRALLRVAALGILGIGVGQVAQAIGVKETTASVATIVSATIPAFVVIFAALRLKQHVTGRQQLGLLAAFGGIVLVAFGSGQGTAAIAASAVIGAAWILLSAVSISFYYVWSVELTSEYGTTTVAAWSTLIGLFALLPAVAWEAGREPIHITIEALGVALYLGVFVAVAGLFMWLHLLRTVPARVAASVQYLQPVFGISAAAAMFGDRLGLLFAIGVVLILVGLALTAAAPSKAP